MTTFVTTITAMYTIQEPDPNYVVNAFWRITGVDGEYTAFIDNNTQFDSTQSSTFIPYNQLTEAIVIGWIPTQEISNAQACVQGQINSMITPPVSPQNTPLPWA
tara:strand:- start:183 stop:494 length:312 start_codon:yes stop_codon:yes gene_type:complete